MTELVQAILRFLRSLKMWVIVSPWEQAIRVRAGKHVTKLGPGFHLRFPILDIVLVQSTRLRFTATDRQTITTLDGKTVTCAGAIGYEIADLEMLYRTVHHAEDTIRQVTRGAIASYLSKQSTVTGQSIELGSGARNLIDLTPYGLSVVDLVITDLAIAKTYRLIGDYAAGYQNGTALDTESKEAKA